MHNNLRKAFYQAAADVPNIDGAGAVAEFAFPMPVIVKKVGVRVTTAVVTDDTVALTATLSRRPVNGSASNPVTLGTFTISTGLDVTIPAGRVIYKDLAIVDHDGEVAEDGSQRNEAPNSNVVGPVDRMDGFLILPGQAFAMTLDTNAEADSGAVVGFVEVVELDYADIYGLNVVRDTSNE
jgi:hypothetical protein